MTSDQRRCIQRSRFVCRILNFCVKTSHADTDAMCLHKGRCGYMATNDMSKLRSRLRMLLDLRSKCFYSGKEKETKGNVVIRWGCPVPLSAVTAASFVGAV